MVQHSSDPLPDAGQHALDGRHRGCCKVMSNCAASRVIYFLLFHNPFHNHNVHTSRTHISPGTSHQLLTCTHLHTPALYSTATAQRLCEHLPVPPPPTKLTHTAIAFPPTPEMISDHALADLANGLGIAAMAFIVLYHFVAVNGKRMEA